MHVNTDSVLLGAWTNGPSNKPCRILDIGTGCGILALMMAQRFAGAGIDAMEIDACAAEEAAAKQISATPSSRIHTTWSSAIPLISTNHWPALTGAVPWPGTHPAKVFRTGN